MRRRAVVLALWLSVTWRTMDRDEEGSAADEALITGAKILAAAVFVAFVMLKVVPFLRSLDLGQLPLLD